MWKVCFLHLYMWNQHFCVPFTLWFVFDVSSLTHSRCSCDILVWFNARKKATFPLCEEHLGFSSQLWQLSLCSNVCCLLQHGGLRGAEGNVWNHLPEVPPVCLQLYVLGESPLRLGLGVSPAAPERWRAFCRLFKNTSDSTSESAETWGRRLRAHVVMMTWSVS